MQRISEGCPPLSHESHSNNSTVTSFRSSGTPFCTNNKPSNVSFGSIYDSGSRMTGRIPAPPPRNQNYTNSYSSPYGNGYNGYTSTSYLNRPMFNSYSPYYQQHYMTPVAGSSSSFGPSFIEEAQESSREAFASIESIVNTFGSINMMIESTYHALHSSFNAVLSVAENFSRLRSQFGPLLSAFTLLRTIQWLFKKLLYLLGIRAIDPTTESAWRTAARSVEDPTGTSPKKSSWPVIMFFIAVYAGPFLMWKFMNSLMQKVKSKDSWVTENEDCYLAIAKYNYDAQSPDELSFSTGDYLKLAPYEKQTDKSWPLASNGKRIGIVPINYIDIKFKSAQSNNTQTSVKKDHPVSSTPNPNRFYNPNQIVNPRSEETSQKQTNIPHTPFPPVHETSKKSEPVKSEASTTFNDIKAGVNFESESRKGREA